MEPKWGLQRSPSIKRIVVHICLGEGSWRWLCTQQGLELLPGDARQYWEALFQIVLNVLKYLGFVASSCKYTDSITTKQDRLRLNFLIPL